VSTVALVARREIVERGRSRAFRISLVAMVLLAAGGAVAASLLGGKAKTYEIGVVGAHADAAAAALPAQVQGTGDRVRVRRPASPAAARADVGSGKLDAALIDGRSVVVKSDTKSQPAQFAAGAARVASSVSTLQQAGVPAARIGAALSPPPAQVTAIEPGARARNTNRGIVTAALVLLYILLISYGSVVLSSVVAEKASRVVEVLLVTVRPRRLLAGKLLGIGVLGMGQILAVGSAALLGRAATGKGAIPAAGVQIFGLSLLWFLLGYALFSAGYAVLGSLVSRQEDTNSAQGPMTGVLVISYIAAISTLGSPDATLAQVCTFVPFTAPMVVPARVVLGHISPLEFALSLVLTLAAIAALVAAAASLYERTILRTGAPLRLRQVLRGQGG